jgi:bifunctional non-homologous end joining protein LigD
LADKVPSGPQWVHEIKHDGYRFVCRREGDHQPFGLEGRRVYRSRFSYSTTAIISISTIASG